MNASARYLYDAATKAADALVGLPLARVHLGTKLTEDTVRDIAKLHGGLVSIGEQVSIGLFGPTYIISFEINWNGVRIEGMSSRRATIGDAERLGACRYGDGDKLTADEIASLFRSEAA